MEKKPKAKVVYSEDAELIGAKDLKGWGIHVLCLEGSGNFNYNGKKILFKKNDAMVISHPDLVSDLEISEDLKVKIVAAPFKFMYNLLPANHYGVGGCISLFEEPVIPLSEEESKRFEEDLDRIKSRMNETDNLFYDEMLGSLELTMIYDLFNFHAKLHSDVHTTERTGNIVKTLISMFEGGQTKFHREVAYYADKLNVSPKYLSETVKNKTGRNVIYLIDRYTVPMVAEYLKNSDLSLKQIAEEMNFKTLSYFCRYVQKHLGMTPSEYRSANSPLKKKFQ